MRVDAADGIIRHYGAYTPVSAVHRHHRRRLLAPWQVWAQPPMKLSFVIPAYNEEAWLGPCVASIMAQLAQATSVQAAWAAGDSSPKSGGYSHL